MKCLTKEQIQCLIDNELSGSEKNRMEAHLAICSKCREKFTEQKQFAELFKIHKPVAETPAPIPAFVPLQNEVVKTKKPEYVSLLLKAVAVLVFAILIWQIFPNRPKEKEKGFTPTAQDIMLYEMSKGVDANTAFQQKTIVITHEDNEGNIKYITN